MEDSADNNVVDGPWKEGAKRSFPVPRESWRMMCTLMALMPILVESIYAIAKGVKDPQALAAEIVEILEDDDDETME